MPANKVTTQPHIGASVPGSGRPWRPRQQEPTSDRTSSWVWILSHSSSSPPRTRLPRAPLHPPGDAQNPRLGSGAPSAHTLHPGSPGGSPGLGAPARRGEESAGPLSQRRSPHPGPRLCPPRCSFRSPAHSHLSRCPYTGLPLPTRELLPAPPPSSSSAPSSLPTPVTGSNPPPQGLSLCLLSRWPSTRAARRVCCSHLGLWPSMCRSPSREHPRPTAVPFLKSWLCPYSSPLHTVHPPLQVPLCRGKGETEGPSCSGVLQTEPRGALHCPRPSPEAAKPGHRLTEGLLSPR